MTAAEQKNLRARLDRQAIQKAEITKMRKLYGKDEQFKFDLYLSGAKKSVVFSNGLVLSRG